MPPLQPKTSDKFKFLGRFKPAAGLAPAVHVLFRVLLPLIIFVLSSLSIGSWLPLLVVFMSKWRIFAVRPRFWPANLRANGIDIMVGVSIVIFMVTTDSLAVRLIWAVVYALWLIFVKPKSGVLGISLQSGIGQLGGLMALFIAWPNGPLLGLVIATGTICYVSARHFFDSYNEPYARMLSYLWAYFGAALMWVLGHLLIVYPRQGGPIAQPTLFLSVIGYSLGAIYYLEHFDKLSLTIKRELLYLSSGAVIILLVSLLYEGAHLIV